jgi:hypothetical protein
MWLLRYLSFTDNRLRGGPRLLVDLGRSQRGFRYFSIDKYQSIPGIDKIDKYRYFIDTFDIFRLSL